MSVSSSVRHNNFNLLRLVFAALVIVAHTPEILDGNRGREPLTQIFGTISFGGFAVDSFFLLSGYLIVKSWVRQPALTQFIKNRVLRIYPGFIAASLLCAFVVAPLAAAGGYFSDFNFPRFLFGLVTLSPPLIPESFEGTYYPVVNGAMWTIRFEFICYAMVAAVGVVGGFRNRFIWPSFLLAFGIGFVLGLFKLHPAFEHPIFRLGMLFAAGGCFFLYGRARLNNGKLMVLALLALLGAMFSHVLVEFAMALCWGYVVISIAERHSPRLAWFNRLPDVSYGVYLYAWPTTKLLLLFQPGMGLPMLLIATALISLVLGILSWYIVEKPFMLLKDYLTFAYGRGARARPAP